MNAIEAIANSSETSKQVFKALSSKQRARRATDLTNLYREMHSKDKTLQEKEILLVFKKLQDADLGSLVIGRRNNHNRFVWGYNLKHVALAAQGKLETHNLVPVKFAKKVKSVKTKEPKKVLKAKSMPQEIIEAKSSTPQSEIQLMRGPKVQIELELSPDFNMKDFKALMELVNEMQIKK